MWKHALNLSLALTVLAVSPGKAAALDSNRELSFLLFHREYTVSQT